jgi:hypothetical protein
LRKCHQMTNGEGGVLTFFSELDPRQTSNFCKQYCDKAIIFLKKILLLLFKISWNNHQFTRWRKKYRFIAILLYLFIAILLVKIARLTRALRSKFSSFDLVWSRGPLSMKSNKICLTQHCTPYYKLSLFWLGLVSMFSFE